MDMQGWMRDARQGTSFLESLDIAKTQIICNAELRYDFAKCVILFKDYIMQTMVIKPQELYFSSAVTETEL